MKHPKTRHPNAKHSFIQYIAATESDDFNNPEEHWITWATNLVSDPKNWLENPIHVGDCTNVCCSCYLCVIERLLSEYRNYFFNGEVPE